MQFDNAVGVVTLGVVVGLQYALLGVGIVLVYKAGRFVNFAQGQLGVIAASLFAILVAQHGWPYWPALGLALLVAGGVGALVEKTVIGRLFDASRLILTVATIGVGQLLFVTTLRGPLRVDPNVLTRKGYPVPFSLHWEVGTNVINASQLLTLILAPLTATALYLFFATTSTGKAIRAASSNPDAARLAGISVRRVSLLVWVAAGLLSGMTAILLAPSQPTLDIGSLGPSLLLRGLAAALAGRMVSLPIAFGAGIGIGVAEQVAFYNVPRGGTADLVVLAIVLLAILLQGRRLAATTRRGDDLLGAERSRPALSARLQGVAVARNLDRLGWAFLALIGVLLPTFPGLESQGKGLLLVLMLCYALVGLSLTLLTGWAGQVSLGHFALLGVGAYTAAHADGHHWAIPAVLIVSGLVAAGVAVVIGLPALRFRGLFLAVSTLGFALAAQSWLFGRTWIARDAGGSATIAHTRLPGIGAIETPRGLYYVGLVVLALAVLALRSLRASGPGRALVAVRDDERAAASHGLTPSTVKILALALSGFLAGTAGGLWGMAQRNWTTYQFDPTLSLVMLSIAIVGGLGTLAGPLLGTLAVFAWPYFVPDANTLLVRIFSSGALLLIVLLFLPGGLISLVERGRRWLLAWIERGLPDRPFGAVEGAPPLVVHDLSLAFGGLLALDDVSLELGEREIVGLIGGNGAGKTTLINCISGHLRPQHGRVVVFGQDVTELPPEYRPHLGAARSFQDAHLYPGLTVLETVMVALDRDEHSGTLGALLAAPWTRAGERRKRAAALEILRRVGLESRAGIKLDELSTGMRRLCDLATVMATRPRLVLLDEPTAGIAQREVEAFAPLLRGLRDDLGCSVLIVEHDMPLLMSICDRVYALESGQVIAQGTPDEVRADPRVVASYLGTDEAAIERSSRVRKVKARR